VVERRGAAPEEWESGTTYIFSDGISLKLKGNRNRNYISVTLALTTGEWKSE